MIISLKNKKGFSLVEVVVGFAILLVTVVATALSLRAVLFAATRANHITEAGFLLEEGVEAVKVIRGSEWANLSGFATDTPYTLVFSGGTWTTQTSKAFVNNLFDRTVTLSAVYRDAGDNIASGGTIDYHTKKVTVDVSWRERSGTTTRSIATYVTDFIE